MNLAPYQPYLDWIATQQPAMVKLVQRWAGINSGSYHLAGLAEMRSTLERAFGVLGGVAETLPLAPIVQINSRGDKIEVPMAAALSITKRPEAPIQVLLVAHMDTVYGADHPFQAAKMLSDNVMNGPGVADLKGGIVVMLHALQALERHGAASGAWLTVCRLGRCHPWCAGGHDPVPQEAPRATRLFSRLMPPTTTSSSPKKSP